MIKQIDTDYIRKTLLELLSIPSPCGFTDEIVHYIGGQLQSMGVSFDVTRRGTIRAKIEGKGGAQARALVTHVDTIGCMVRYIKDDGRILVAPIGYWSSRFAESARVTLFSESGAYRGTLLPTVNWGVSRDHGVESVPMNWDCIELRLDEMVYDAQGVRDLGISVGDYISLDSNPEILENGYIVGRNLDNKAGVASVLCMLKHLSEDKVELPEDLFVIFTITETTGTGTGSAVLPEVSELVTIDFASVAATDKSPLKKVNIPSSDASGPYDYHLNMHLQKLAIQHDIPHKRELLEAFHSDAASALAAGHDVRAAVVTYAGDASHSMERTHIESLQNVIRLMAAYATEAPTFSSDTLMTTVDEFSHQIQQDNLPPERMPVPKIQDLIRQKKDKS